MKKAYQFMILVSLFLFSFLLNSRPAYAGEPYMIDNASRAYDFKISMDGSCSKPDMDDYGTCDGPATIDIYLKDNKQIIQTLKLENIFISFAGGSRPLVNSARLYDYQGVINTGDFNFDGQEDFAVQNGNNGPYNGPSYDVYLYSADKKIFEFSEPLSSLTLETLGFFQVDKNKKLLHTSSKGGCCYHEFVSHSVEHNIPIPVYRVIEDASGADGEYVDVITEKLVDNKWQSKTERFPIKDYYR